MGSFGCGTAFNLRYRPNGPMRTYIYERPAPRPSIFCGMGTSSYTQNITYDMGGPKGFWGFLSGFLNSFMMMGGMSCLAGLGGGGGSVKPQGASDDEGAAKINYGKNLEKMSPEGSKVVDNGDGTYSINIPDKGIISGKYNDLMEQLKELAKPSTPKKDPAVQQQQQQQQVQQPPATVEHEKDDAISASDLSSFTGNCVVIDEDLDDTLAKYGRNSHITGAFGVKTAGDADSKNFPKVITVGSQEYTYAGSDDGGAIYKSTSSNAKGQYYRMEWNSNSQLQLIQHSDEENEQIKAGLNIADVSKKKAKTRTTYTPTVVAGGSNKSNRFINGGE